MSDKADLKQKASLVCLRSHMLQFLRGTEALLCLISENLLIVLCYPRVSSVKCILENYSGTFSREASLLSKEHLISGQKSDWLSHPNSTSYLYKQSTLFHFPGPSWSLQLSYDLGSYFPKDTCAVIVLAKFDLALKLTFPIGQDLAVDTSKTMCRRLYYIGSSWYEFPGWWGGAGNAKEE